MRKLLLLLFIIIGSRAYSHAQVNDNALGLRFGYGGGISYQKGLNKINRIEGDLGFGFGEFYSYYRFSVAYHWVFETYTDFNIFIGPAATIGNVAYKDLYYGNNKDGIYLTGGAQLGVDYNWENIPIQISLDVMPQFKILNGYNDVTFDPAFGLRWVF